VPTPLRPCRGLVRQVRTRRPVAMARWRAGMVAEELTAAVGEGRAALALLVTSIQRSAWNRNSTNFEWGRYTGPHYATKPTPIRQP
jgi:hypothetical protein